VKLSRRKFVALTSAAASAALIGMSCKSGNAARQITGGFVNEAFPLGHKLRDHTAFPAPKQQKKIPVVIIGGGMAGLNAAWWLEKHGFRDFVILEMEHGAGGNSRWGENEVSAYPWAAHYIPVPNKNALHVRMLMEELDALKDGVWNERMLCFAPQERLFLYGRWQEGLEPQTARTPSEQEQYKRFDDFVRKLRDSGKFTIPLEECVASAPVEIAALDKISFSKWLADNNFTGKSFLWERDYECRDDYGSSLADTSAWAGIHYHAGRQHDEKGPLTWPEGNGWIARRLNEKLKAYIQSDAVVWKIREEKNGFKVLTQETEYSVEFVIFAAPTFIAPYILDGRKLDLPTQAFQYSPWLTANLTLDQMPRENGAELAWDNVFFNSKSLGYVDASHQNVAVHRSQAVWTYYWALAEMAPRDARTFLLNSNYEQLCESILHDMEQAHPDIRECVKHLDIMRMGHAMIRPSPGAIFDPQRRALANGKGRLLFANSDVSGISIFEEAQDRGIRAAQKVLDGLGHNAKSQGM